MFGPDKYYIHADVNGHFAYSSLIYYPELLDVPVVVGGNEEARHGIVLSKGASPEIPLSERPPIETMTLTWNVLHRHVHYVFGRQFVWHCGPANAL